MLGPISHKRIQERILNFPLFNPDDYLTLHVDLQNARINGTNHYAQYGLWEDREFASKTTIARKLGLI